MTYLKFEVFKIFSNFCMHHLISFIILVLKNLGIERQLEDQLQVYFDIWKETELFVYLLNKRKE